MLTALLFLVIVLAAVSGAEFVRTTCRRMLSSPAGQSATSARQAPALAQHAALAGK